VKKAIMFFLVKRKAFTEKGTFKLDMYFFRGTWV
jgi:hypothetical protein